jgi:hypothetical protein
MRLKQKREQLRTRPGRIVQRLKGRSRRISRREESERGRKRKLPRLPRKRLRPLIWNLSRTRGRQRRRIS